MKKSKFCHLHGQYEPKPQGWLCRDPRFRDGPEVMDAYKRKFWCRHRMLVTDGMIEEFKNQKLLSLNEFLLQIVWKKREDEGSPYVMNKEEAELSDLQGRYYAEYLEEKKRRLSEAEEKNSEAKRRREERRALREESRKAAALRGEQRRISAILRREKNEIAKSLRMIESARLREEKGGTKAERRIKRKKFNAELREYRRSLKKTEEASTQKRKDFHDQLISQWGSVCRDERVGALRREAWEAGKAAAEERYAEAKRIIAEYKGPGGGGRYNSSEEAAEARRRYLRAYSCIYNKKPESKARQRDQENKQRSIRKKRRAGGCAVFYTEMLTAPEAHCFYCQKELQVHQRVGDHYIPLAKGGPHTVENLRIACSPCNSAKSDLMPEEFNPCKS